MTLSTPEFNYVRRLVLDQSAIVLEEDKGYLVESRLLSLARREGSIFLFKECKLSPFKDCIARPWRP